MDLRTAERYARGHRCPDCWPKSLLIAFWDSRANTHAIRCGGCGTTDMGLFEKIKSLTAIWRENPDSLPIPMANRFADKYRHQIEAETEGLRPELQTIARERYLGRPPKKE